MLKMNFFKSVLIFLVISSSFCIDSVIPVKRGRIKQVHRPRIPQPTGKQNSSKDPTFILVVAVLNYLLL